MTVLDSEWMSKENRKWLTRDQYGMRVPRDDAPENVKRSYDNYHKELKAVLQREKEIGGTIL